MTEHDLWTSEIQAHYPLITETALSPDGEHVVYAVREPVLTVEESKYITHLYMVATAAEEVEPVQLTHGAYTNHTARWSPDGHYLAFLSDRDKGKDNVYVMRVGGGEPWPLTAFAETKVADVEWSPDGSRLALVAVPPPTEEKLAARKAKDDAILWGEDYDFQHVFTVPFERASRELPEVTQLTGGRFHVLKLAWLPDGASLALSIRPTPEEETWTETQLSLIPAELPEGGAPFDETGLSVLAPVPGWAPEPKPSPDGAFIACVTGEQPVHWAGADRVVLYPVAGGEPRPLVSTPDGQCWIIGWDEAGTKVYVGESSGIDTHVWALSTTEQAGTPVLATPTYKAAFHTNGGDEIAFAEETFTRPNAVHLWRAGDADSSAGGRGRQIAAPFLPAEWPDAPLPEVEVLSWEASTPLPDEGAAAEGSKARIEGIVVYPIGHRRGERCPLVVDVHGGPAGVFQRRYLGSGARYCDVLSLAQRGIAVLRGNPRGSSGYGRAFRFANYGDWGCGDFQDICDGVDLLVERGVADPDRLGIMGWSYGGYMTSRAITQSDCFRAACVGAGVTNLMSFNGTTDIPGFVPDYFDAEFWEDLEPYQRHSAMFHIRGVTTPTLIQHGQADIRVPLGQGRELYNALKRQGVPVKMVIYPRQGHAIGEPRLRVDMRRRPVEWFARWLLDDGEDA